MNYRFSLEHTAYLPDQIPDVSRPQVLLAGRSNAGKSSLINCLAGSNKLARTSSTPGKTRSINFFRIHPGDFFLVDLPGYGYAKCSKKERNKWAELMEHYLSRSGNIQGMVLIIDSRIPPQPLDLELASFAEQCGFNLILVLTKIDKCKQKQQNKAKDTWKRLYPEAGRPVPFSAKTGYGRDSLWARILETAGIEPDQSAAGEEKERA
jgi:GTP-binding protein